MNVELDGAEIDFLLEALRYAEMDFEKRISEYPEPARTEYNRDMRSDKRKMFEKVRGALTAAKK
ncbi:MAG: hypothetical protein WCT52_03950 [Candidatus Micrarchaeia archaeon]